MVRQINEDRPLKLSLSRLVSKQSLGYLLSGLKGNSQVHELNLGECGLDDEDLEKIAYRLREDGGIRTLKLGQNQFATILPLIPLIKMKGKQYRSLDISSMPIDREAMESGFIEAVGSMSGLEELLMCECLTDTRIPDVQRLVDSLLRGCLGLRSIDISKNMLSRENLNHFLKMLAERGANSIEALAMSQVSIQRESFPFLINAVSALGRLKKLNISGNDKLGGQSVQSILRALIKNQSIEDLDISKTGIGNDHQSMQLLGELVKSNKRLRMISLQRLGLSEVAAYHLIDPLSQALNIEVLNFDNNNLGPIFAQNLINKLMAYKQVDNIRRGGSQLSGAQSPGGGSKDSSIMTDETGGNDADQASGWRRRESDADGGAAARAHGLASLSLEGNPHIGDRGASAIAALIQTQNAFSNNLKIVNLNECGITNTGFEHLK